MTHRTKIDSLTLIAFVCFAPPALYSVAYFAASVVCAFVGCR